MRRGAHPWLVALLGCGLAACSKPNPVWGLLDGSDTSGPSADDPAPEPTSTTAEGTTDSESSGSDSTTTDDDPSTTGDDSGGTTSDSSGGSSGSTSSDGLACGGTAYAGFCWYYGDLGQSCDDVCVPHGGYDQAGTRDFVGSGAPTNARCAEVMPLVGPDVVVQSETSFIGLGCHWFETENEIRWEDPGPTLSGAAVTNARRLCACAQ